MDDIDAKIKTWEQRKNKAEMNLNKLNSKKKTESQKARNKRTKRLVEIGAEVEKVVGCEIPKEDLPLLVFLLNELDFKAQFRLIKDNL